MIRTLYLVLRPALAMVMDAEKKNLITPGKVKIRSVPFVDLLLAL